MSETQKASLGPEVVLGELKKNGVTHVIWLPDSETKWLFMLMKAESSLRLVGVLGRVRRSAQESYALGLALAQPERNAVVFDSASCDRPPSRRVREIG